MDRGHRRQDEGYSLNRLLRYRLTPVLGAMGLGWWALQRLSPVESGEWVLVCIAAATLIIYPLDPILDPRDRGPLEGPRFWTLIRLILAVALFLIALMELRSVTRIVAATGLLLSLLYSIPFGAHRIKDHSALKILFIGIAISLACLGLPWLQSDSAVLQDSMVLFAVMLLLVMSNVIVCDIRDHRRDMEAGLNTIATRDLSLARITVAVISLLICISIRYLHDGESILRGAGLVLAAVVLVLASRLDGKDTAMTLLADGAMTLPALLELIISGSRG